MERRKEASTGAVTETASIDYERLTGEQNALVAQLNDMFGEVVSTAKIIAVCNSFNWQLAECIEALINPELKIDEISENVSTFSSMHTGIPQETLEINQSKLMNVMKEKTVGMEDFSQDKENKNLGAIPKWMPRTNQLIENVDKTQTQRALGDLTENSNAEFFQQLIKSSKQQKTTPSRNKQLDPLLRKIRQGYKVMIIMRGIPGSGKSHLAKQIIDETVNGSAYQNHIFSTDDYFCDRNGNYVYRPDELSAAHDMNQMRTKAQALNGWSPLIIDNTNIKQWEMFAYVEIAVVNGYLLEIVEPKTYWSKSAGKCAIKNRHGVPKDKIQRMIDNFEHTSVKNLMQICNCEYNVPVPQLRLLPPLNPSLKQEQASNQLSSTKMDSFAAIQKGFDVVINPKGGNLNIVESGGTNNKDLECNQEIGIPADNAEDWKSYEQESEEYWREQQEKIQQSLPNDKNSFPKPPRRQEQKKNRRLVDAEQNVEKLTMPESGDLISFNTEVLNPGVNQNIGSTIATNEKLERHDIGCDNENKNFSTLRQIYPNKEVDGLWDLFEKCQGDIDWAVDILLKDDSCVDQQSNRLDNAFQCSCNQNISTTATETFGSYETGNFCEDIRDSNSPKRQRTKRTDKLNNVSNELNEIKKTLENQFVLGDEFYSERLRKVRDFHHKLLANPCESHVAADETQLVEEGVQTIAAESKENDDMSSEPDDDETVEIILGETLVEQLESIFDSELIPKNMIKDLKTNVSIPKSLAYQLYLVWVESVYNQVEEESDKILKDDEFSELPQSNAGKKYTDAKSLGNELVSHFYADKNYWEANAEDLASHITKLKLSEEFSEIEQNAQFQTLRSIDNRCEENDENFESTQRPKMIKMDARDTLKETTVKSTDSERVYLDSALNQDKLRKIALHNFELNRNMAVHHSQLKAECYQKAKEAIQKGNTTVAVYYSQIADLHKEKIETFNHAAANYIIAAHDATQNNPDFIDLHYLHVSEAEQCLDIFVDKHIRKLKSINKSYKYIFIITGRGLHSAGGVSIIKNKVKSRLKERNLRWSELNPGLLKVKIFVTSKFGNKVDVY